MTRTGGNRGGGRRSLGSDAQRGATVQRSIRIHDELWADVVAAADAAGVTTSQYVRKALLGQLGADKYLRKGSRK